MSGTWEASNSTRLTELRAEWLAAQARLAESEAHEADRLTAQWTSLFRVLVARERELKQAGDWIRGRADFFGVMSLERAEIRHSRMIAWLLDPLGQHGLGVSVLRRLLLACFPEKDFETLDDAQPQCEVVKGPCRADIVVWLPSQTLIIENKVDAAESIGQCDVICTEFESKPDPMFVFLTPEGRLPENSSGVGRDLFQPLAYREFREMLRSALGESARRGDGRHVASDYLRTLELEFK
jgi:hypothetical protein